MNPESLSLIHQQVLIRNLVIESAFIFAYLKLTIFFLMGQIVWQGDSFHYPIRNAHVYWMIFIPLSHCSCSVLLFRGDYLVIRNENGEDFGRYCGFRPGTTALLNGTIVVLTFHSDSTNNGGRFRLVFTPIYRKWKNKIFISSVISLEQDLLWCLFYNE